MVEPTHLKNMLVKFDHETPGRDENKTYLKPPARSPRGHNKSIYKIYLTWNGNPPVLSLLDQPAGDFRNVGQMNQWTKNNKKHINPKIQLMDKILHQLIGSLSHYLQGFIHTRRCRISSINSITGKVFHPLTLNLNNHLTVPSALLGWLLLILEQPHLVRDLHVKLTNSIKLGCELLHTGFAIITWNNPKK